MKGDENLEKSISLSEGDRQNDTPLKNKSNKKIWIFVGIFLVVIGIIIGVFLLIGGSSEDVEDLESGENGESGGATQTTKIETTTSGELNFDEEWEVYQRYLSAIENRDLEELSLTSYRNFTECFEFYKDDCWDVIKEISTREHSKEDIVEVWRNDKQSIILTEIIKHGDGIPRNGGGYSRNFRSFIRNSKGELIVFSPAGTMNCINPDYLDSCVGTEEYCLNLSIQKYCSIGSELYMKDSDGDGWWDSTEITMGTDPNDPDDYPFKA